MEVENVHLEKASFIPLNKWIHVLGPSFSVSQVSAISEGNPELHTDTQKL